MTTHLGDQIEAYVLGRLTGHELDAAEEHLLGCGECFEAAALLEAAIGVAREGERFRLPERPATRPFSLSTLGAALGALWQRPAWGALAGAVAAALVVGVLGREPRIDRGGLALLEAYPLSTETLRSAPTEAPERTAGLADYQAGRYAEAARRLEKHVAARPEDNEARFYLAVSLLLAGEPRQAIPHLDRLVAGGGGYLRDAWYLAQAYLAIGEPDAARPYLRTVAASDWIHAAAARQQLAALPPPGSQK